MFAQAEREKGRNRVSLQWSKPEFDADQHAARCYAQLLATLLTLVHPVAAIF
jgi:hypothetical protein